MDEDGGIRGNKQEEQEKSDEQPCHYGPTRHHSNEEAKHERRLSTKHSQTAGYLNVYMLLSHHTSYRAKQFQTRLGLETTRNKSVVLHVRYQKHN